MGDLISKKITVSAIHRRFWFEQKENPVDILIG